MQLNLKNTKILTLKNKKSFYFSEFISEPEILSILSEKNKTVIKLNKNSEVCVFQFEKKLLVKIYQEKRPIKRFIDLFRTNKAKRSFFNAIYLTAHGILTPKPFAYMEKKLNFFTKRYYFISEFIAGDLASSYFKQNQVAPEILQNISNLIQKMAACGVSHADFQPGNLIINHHQVYLIDLDYMRVMQPAMRRFKRIHRRQVGKFLGYLNATLKAGLKSVTSSF